MTEVKVPSVAESISEVTLSKWMVKDGDYVVLDQPICEVETDKASQELSATIAGVISLVAKEGDDVKVGGLIAKIDETAKAPAKAAEKEAPKKETTVEAPVVAKKAEQKVEVKQEGAAAGHPSPAAKKILDEGGVKTADVKASGVGGKNHKRRCHTSGAQQSEYSAARSIQPY
jgi:2-oxoglutarate dehydrogenase E2 component (dihydrolipoamide succinyltransferase)